MVDTIDCQVEKNVKQNMASEEKLNSLQHIAVLSERVAQLAEHCASIPKVVSSIPTVVRHIFQACPVWIYTQSNITSIIFP